MQNKQLNTECDPGFPRLLNT